jgi:hypothetical protein
MEVIDHVGKGPTFFSQKELHKMFNDQGYSDYIVVYLRLITSGQLQRDSEFYQHFIEGDRSVADFCHQASLKGYQLSTLQLLSAQYSKIHIIIIFLENYMEIKILQCAIYLLVVYDLCNCKS